MRVTLLPREAAARLITGAVSVFAFSAGLTIIILTIPVLVDTFVRNGYPEAIPVPLALLVLLVAAIVVCLWRPGRAVVIAYLVIGAALAVCYEVELLTVDPGLLDDQRFLVNRPTLALVAIGVTSTSAIAGLLWCVSGFVVAMGVAGFVAVTTGTPFAPGYGPAMALLVAAVMYLTLFTIQARQRRRLPRFEELEDATRRRAAGADLARRATAVVHDTVLNDLTVVMNAPDVLDERSRRRLIDDLDTLAGGAWVHATSEVVVPDENQARIRNELARIASDFRWRGLTVNVTGVTTGVYLYEPNAGDALVAAIRAALENVLQHSGTDVAEVNIMYSAESVTFMISDQGVGFDPEDVDANRLGMRGSIVARMEAVGGRARIWSTPGSGTTVLLSIPVTAVLDPGAPPRHQEVGRGE
ncbi:hypothetical protein FJ656_17600 [Schumannella luteola]|nr:hypothetical protein FJ656_17600 [Schumannella luteola]